MIQVDIPGSGRLEIKQVIFDYNGTIARDGIVLDRVKDGIREFAGRIDFYVVTADTFGTVQAQLRDVQAEVSVIAGDSQDQSKLDFLNRLGPEHTVCVGNGRNDVLMLEHASVGIAVLGDEGCASAALAAADILIRDVADVFGFLRTPDRLVATLRN